MDNVCSLSPVIGSTAYQTSFFEPNIRHLKIKLHMCGTCIFQNYHIPHVKSTIYLWKHKNIYVTTVVNISLNFTGTHHPKLFLPTACDFQNFGVRIRCHINVIALKLEKSLFYSISVFYLPLYSIPSVLLHGEAATSSGIVNGSFFNPSKLFPNAYKLPSFGSGKNAGLKTKHDKNM